MKTRIAVWFCVAVVCIVASWRVYQRVQEVDDAAVKFQALDHFNNSLR
jgi:hypothetical protein